MTVANKRGPSPHPTALKLLNGERHRDRINQDEPVPSGRAPIPPPGISAEVRAVWDAVVAELDVMGLAHSADSDSLHCYCEAVAMHRKASAILAKSPMLVKSRYDTWMKNPALQVQRDAAHVIRAFAQEFGLTPSARSTIRAGEAGRGSTEENPFAGTG
jgi:P27 family predicted phage terminase small subunit